MNVWTIYETCEAINLHTWFLWTTCGTCGLHVERVKPINLRMCIVWSTCGTYNNNNNNNNVFKVRFGVERRHRGPQTTYETHEPRRGGSYEAHDPPHVDPVVHMWKTSSPHASHVTPTCEPHVYSCVFRTKHVKHMFSHVFHKFSTQNHVGITCEKHGVLP